MSFLTVLRHFKREWGPLAIVTVLSVFGAVMDAASVMFVVALADAISRGASSFDRTLGPFAVSLSIPVLAALALAAVATSVAAVFLGNSVKASAVARWSTERREDLLRAFVAARWSVQAKDRSGRLQALLGYIGTAASLLSSIAGTVRGFSGLVILIGTALVISPVAALGILLLGTLLYLVLRPLNRYVKRRSREAAALGADVSELFGELSELSREITLFGVGERFRARAEPAIEQLGEAERRVNTLSSAVTPIYQGMALGLIVIALAAAARLGSVDVAVLGAVALLVLRSVSYGQQLQTSLAGVHGASPSLELLEAATDELHRQRGDHGDVQLDTVRNVRLDHVTFAYDREEPALHDLSLTLRHGEIVGIVGPSGAGKSTLAQLLLRLRAPTSGVISVNGEDAGTYSDDSWARSVALVPQEPFLLHGTVHENIAFLRPTIDRDRVEQAARSAGIHDTIEALDEGYDTPVGRTMRNLSGGQVQRIGIARALANHPSLIVLDEPTSALDQHSEAIVQRTLDELRTGALVVVIAHRLTTLSICDRVIVLAGGRVEAEGELHEVMRTSAFFQGAIAPLVLPGDGVVSDLASEAVGE